MKTIQERQRELWLNRLWETDVPSHTKSVAVYIESRIDPDTLYCQVDNRTIARHCSISFNTTITHMKLAIKHGLIFKKRQSRKANLYSIIPFDDEKVK